MSLSRTLCVLSLLLIPSFSPLFAEDVNILEEGDFESQRGGVPAGFDWTGFAGDPSVTPNKFELITEGDSQFVRLTVPPATAKEVAAVQVKEMIPLPADWTGLKVSVKLRVQDYVQGAEGWNAVKVMLLFFDSNGEKIGSDVPAISLKDDASEWVALEKEIQIPPGAQSFKINAGFLGSSGIADIDDLSVVPVK